MGQCFDKYDDEKPARSIQKKRAKGQLWNNSALLYKDFLSQTIQEEDPYQSVATQEAQSTDSGGLLNQARTTVLMKQFQEFQRQHPLGCKIESRKNLLLKNVHTNRYLHSHVVKKNRCQEVCACEAGTHEHDKWMLLGEHFYDGCYTNIYHPLTKSNLKAGIILKSQRIGIFAGQSCNANEDTWILELLGIEKELHVHSLVRIDDYLSEGFRHKQTDGYLHSASSKGLLGDTFGVSLCFTYDLQDVWFVCED